MKSTGTPIAWRCRSSRTDRSGSATRFRAKWKQGPVIESTCTLFERPRIWRYENGGPISVVLTVTLEATPSGGTRMTSRGVWTPHGWFRLAFPVFIRVMRRAERGVVANARHALEEGRDAAAFTPRESMRLNRGIGLKLHP